ncbi:MAG: polysaccharide pyruvyl transferase family protein [Fibrobacteria bacterium]|nr:polysaccharide pyruvyl transferase family protein [Fibrobacteria bacterium]
MSRIRKKVGIIWAAPASENLGVSALSWSTASLLQVIASRRDWDLDLHFFCANGNGRITLSLPGGDLPATTHGYLDLTRWKTYLKGILRPSAGLLDLPRMDLVLDVGEGDSFSDIYGVPRFDRLVATKKFLSRWGRKQVLMPQTIGPFAAEEVRERAKSAMENMEVIFARDRQSAAVAESLLGPGACEEIVDLAFLLPFEQSPRSTGPIRFGLNVSGLLWNGGYTGKNQFNLAGDYQEIVRRISAKILETSDMELHLLGHVLSERFPVEDDYRVCQDLAKELSSDRVHVAPRFKDPCEAKSYISGMDVFSGARMHSCIGAFSAGVPVVPMAYSRKFNGLFQETLRYPWLADLCVDSADTVVEKVLKGIDDRFEMAKAIEVSREEVISPRLDILSKRIETCLGNP